MFWNDPGFIADFIRGFFAVLDSIGYFFLGGIFNIFFAIANANIFQGDLINTFYSRVQMILGILMIFRLSITLLQIILNPDLFKDNQKGAASLIKRIAIMLVLLSLIVPIDIPDTDGNPLNEQFRSNGILFGFLYQFQNSVVEDNILGKLILGSNTESTGSNEGGTQLPGMENVGDVITADIAKAFITPTLNDGFDDITEDNFEDAAACSDVVTPYFNSELTSGTLLDHINDTCNANGEVYAFNYTGFGGIIVSIVMTIIVIGFTLDVAVRAIKLAVLRLIAPVPIISYISPGQEKDGAFGNWVKTLTSTYLSLFIRLIIIYFGIYLIIILRENELVSWAHTSNALTTALANIFIIIGILVFMKDAPKFFQDMLGIKSDGKLFSGIGTMLGAAALTGGLVGSVATGVRAGWEEGAEFRDKSEKGTRGRMLRNIATGATAGLAGLTSGLGGAFVGAKALATADKNVPSSVMSAMQKRNAMRASHSTLPGRVVSGATDMFTGLSLAERDKQALEYSQNAVKQMKEWKSFTESEAIKKGDFGAISEFDANGKETDISKYIKANGLDRRILGTRFNYAVLKQRIEKAGPSGNFDYNGIGFNARDFDDNIMGEILKNQNHNYVQDVFSGAKENPGILSNWELAKSALNKAEISYNGSYLDPNDIGKTIGIASSKAQEMQTGMKHIKHIANHNANKSK